jgi:hypothetical protein
MEINTSPMKITVKRNRKPTKQSERRVKSPRANPPLKVIRRMRLKLRGIYCGRKIKNKSIRFWIVLETTWKNRFQLFKGHYLERLETPDGFV